MLKRGQITLFIVVGIVIVLSIILVVVLRGSLLKATTEQELGKALSFTDSVSGVKNVVDACLEESLKKGVAQLGNKKVDNYEAELGQVVQGELYRCIDFSQLSVTVLKKTPEVTVSLSEDRSRMIAELDYELIVKRGEEEERLREFSTELSLFTECCVPVSVDSECRAKESGEFRVCVSQYNLREGDSLMVGGECLAC
ncbi:hypothetical protein HY501_00260 [Candidatus Woesearchaeota archaeon]|nr:hypothetical protein [Candidatus Woesearchaeota archaeon]